ncbi:MAG: hypothetical protein ACK559_39820, partial [bacterium]
YRYTALPRLNVSEDNNFMHTKSIYPNGRPIVYRSVPQYGPHPIRGFVFQNNGSTFTTVMAK